MYREVVGLAGRWSSLCLALRLVPSDQSAIAAAHPGNPHDCLQTLVVKWLQKSYNYHKYGPPTWRILVEAVGDQAGGNNYALAETIAKKHPIKTADWKKSSMTSIEEQPISDDEWEPSTEFSIMLIKVTELLNESVDVEYLKSFLKYLSCPRTGRQYVDIELFKNCRTPQEIIDLLFPSYINFMNTQLLRQIVRRFGNEKSKALLEQYEDNFPRDKPLKRMRTPLSDEEIQNCPECKKMKVMYDGNTKIDTTTIADVEIVRHTISRNTGIDDSMIVYANQTPGSVIFIFLIPKTVVSSFSDLDECSRRDLADHGILSVEVNDLVIDLQPFQTKCDSSQAETNIGRSHTENTTDTLLQETKTSTFHTETTTDPSQTEKKSRASQPKIKTDTSQPQAKTDTSQVETMFDTLRAETMSTYTTPGMKRVPLTHDFPTANHCKSEFQQLLSEVGALVADSVDAADLQNFLQSFSHILYPEFQYIDLSVQKEAEFVHQIFTGLHPQFINFLNWGILWKAVNAFDIKVMPAFQSYTSRFPPHLQLSTLPDPLSEEEISHLNGFQRLRVTCCDGSKIEWTLGDVYAVREAIEKATGIDQDFIIFAYWEGGFSTQQFTFLIPNPTSRIFVDLCEEDLTILAASGVERLEVDYNTVEDNVQEHYNRKKLPQPETPDREVDRMSTKGFGLEHFIPEDEVEQMSNEEFNYLNDLIKSTPPGKFQEICSNDFLKKFAKMMGNWKDLAPYLGINQWKPDDLAEVYPQDEEEQKYEALLSWKSVDVNSATYERLVECFLRHGHVDDAKKLLLQFQGEKQNFVSLCVADMYVPQFMQVVKSKEHRKFYDKNF